MGHQALPELVQSVSAAALALPEGSHTVMMHSNCWMLLLQMLPLPHGDGLQTSALPLAARSPAAVPQMVVAAAGAQAAAAAAAAAVSIFQSTLFRKGRISLCVALCCAYCSFAQAAMACLPDVACRCAEPRRGSVVTN
jgi:hypothetical protein